MYITVFYDSTHFRSLKRRCIRPLKVYERSFIYNNSRKLKSDSLTKMYCQHA